VLGLLALGAASFAAVSSATPRSPARTARQAIAVCPISGPRVVFPQSSPFRRSGPGAVVWGGATDGHGCGPTHPPTLAPITSNDLLGSPRALSEAAASVATAAATTRGQVVVALDERPGKSGKRTLALTEARADRAFPTARPLAGASSPPPATATGYLGDFALARVTASRAGTSHSHAMSITLDVQRHFEANPFLRGVYAVGSTPVSALGVALDYRADALLTWVQAGRLLVRFVSASGPARTTQSLGSAVASAPPAALISDDGRAIVAWVSQRARTNGSRRDTDVYLSISGPGARFAAPRLVEHFSEPSASTLPRPRADLVRLSNESVTMAWTGLYRSEHYVVRSAAVGLNAMGHITTLSDPRADALLGPLVAGPRADALALWSSPNHASPGTNLDGRLFVSSFKHVRLGPLVHLAGPGRYADPAAAFDPASDRALVAWRADDSPAGPQYARLAPLVAAHQGG